MKFEKYNISPDLKKSIAALGFKRPTDIQFKAIPNILKGEDVLAIAQTGTGKTAAFAIPVLNLLHERRLRQRRADGIKCLVMVPTRELAIQITDVFLELSKHLKVRCFCLFGGVEQEAQISKLEKGIDLLVATPGRMFDLNHQGHLDLSRVEILILDEADQMLDLGFYKDIQDVLRYLPKRRQTLFFSATIDEKIRKLAYTLVHKPIRIQISPKDPITKKVQHSVAFIEMDEKRFFLERLIKEHPDNKLLVFVRTKVRAERLLKAMERVQIDALNIHGDKDQKERLHVMKQFKLGKVKVLIATDVSARGIDIPNVEYVINYDMPVQAENYVHRVGRTGRGSHSGFAVSFCCDAEKPLLEEVEQLIGKPVTRLLIDKKTHQNILDFSEDQPLDWKALRKEMDDFEQMQRRKRKKK